MTDLENAVWPLPSASSPCCPRRLNIAMQSLLPSGRARWLIAACLLAAVAVWSALDWYVAYPVDAKRTYAGGQSCAQCHENQHRLWTGSHHDRAMELPTPNTVLGDFNDAAFTRFGVTTRFFRRDDKYFVNTEGPDGEFRNYEVKYTFGVEPLQQYMVEIEGGRIQVLRVSWDTRKNEWFYVTPSDVTDQRIEPGDPLHWTGIGQNWNTMCAECHSTDLQKNYDLATNSYHTTYSEIDVSCETCHGPASMHVEMAEGRSLFWDRHHGYGLHQLKGASAEQQVETCAPCHSRRSPLHPDYHAGENFLDHYDPSLLYSGLYHTDGQILDEVYVYGSFVQSKMFSRGVRCTDCHNPHSLKLKFEGNRLCAQCHPPGKYDTPNHHHHTDQVATQCVSCHMPATTYMVIDDRRDHSLRVPRPDLTVELGTPNACNGCHTDPKETPAWAAEAVRNWYGEQRPDDPHYAHAFAAAQQTKAEGVGLIRQLLRRRETPDIVRATAVDLLGNYNTNESDTLCREAIEDRSPLVRAAGVRAISTNSLGQFVLEVADRLHDSVRMVRANAARRLVRDAAELVGSRFRASLDKAVKEYRLGQQVMLDRAGAHINLAAMSQALGDNDSTIEELRTAMRLEPYLSGVRDELAKSLEQAGGGADEIRRLREEEVVLLERDSQLLPGNAQAHYRRGMLLYLLEDLDEARGAFETACGLAPNSFENWMVLALICEKQSRWEQCVAALKKMQELRPNDQATIGIYQRMQQAAQAEAEEKDETGE